MNTCMIYVATSGPEEAQKLAETLVSEQLVACVNIIDGVTSVYRWQGKIESSQESLLIAKTTHERREAAMVRLRDLHSYDTPCIVAYDMTAGVPEYLDWITHETTLG
ncbi:MAG: divalent-cation tolerance protein CutA [Rhodospirillaceae bacterium]|jgi:periplasmic divalent cation tolerance protein|nr:divalent-cation tolerance protein CutA [Rhodospirillaceae bacterium]MBT5239847.1 divalent-cation tolerance protein CutA [Rhodospirillaceae bacterium]MBT5567137.1 divalent-cation tolerance protein CutA [Rhodospirillaceae bacterium]MBT6089350.1 divalent-cation tolerance protein CutA [Rhodospirillaceae bacterium]MBT7450269.1 divalent-cation tolerance protein CutA [Rhodospirillaceae bacterium]